VCSVADCTPLLIQQNDGSGSMNRPWAEYKVGFGDPSGNYWLGNDLLSQLTANNRYKLRFDLQKRDTGNWYYAEYSTFRVLSEADDYKLQVGGFSGNASVLSTDAFSQHNGQKFITIDRDNDRKCAKKTGGGFWWQNSERHCGWCRVNSVGGTGSFWFGGLPGAPHLQLSRMWLQCK